MSKTNKREKFSHADINPLSKLARIEYRQRMNPYIVGYTDNPAVPKGEEGLPTNVLNTTIVPLPTPEGEEVTEPKSFRETIGDRDYKYTNPYFTYEVCRALSKRNCRNCYGTGLQHFSIPEKVKWSEGCRCVKNKLDKMEKQAEGTKRAILGY